MLVLSLLLGAVLLAQGHAQDCLCFTSNSVNIRDTPCGNVIGSANTGACYENRGGSESCVLSGITYNFLEFTYAGSSGWAADDYLSAGNCPEPGVPGNCNNVPRVSRAEWGARSPDSVSYLGTPVTTVYVHHTVTAQCYSEADCSAQMRQIQSYHMDSLGWSDIGYNWLIGSDGQAYEGRGFDVVGTHTCCGDCNRNAVAISLIGNFHPEDGGVNPTDSMMQDVRDLIDCAVGEGAVVDWSSLNILGHIDACATACPGSAAYSYIQTWAEYGRIPDPCYC